MGRSVAMDAADAQSCDSNDDNEWFAVHAASPPGVVRQSGGAQVRVLLPPRSGPPLGPVSVAAGSSSSLSSSLSPPSRQLRDDTVRLVRERLHRGALWRVERRRGDDDDPLGHRVAWRDSSNVSEEPRGQDAVDVTEWNGVAEVDEVVDEKPAFATAHASLFRNGGLFQLSQMHRGPDRTHMALPPRTITTNLVSDTRVNNLPHPRHLLHPSSGGVPMSLFELSKRVAASGKEQSWNIAAGDVDEVVEEARNSIAHREFSTSPRTGLFMLSRRTHDAIVDIGLDVSIKEDGAGEKFPASADKIITMDPNSNSVVAYNLVLCRASS